MKFTVEERADRLLRKRWGFVDRGSMAWGGLAMNVALMDLQRELVKGFDPLLTRLARLLDRLT